MKPVTPASLLELVREDQQRQWRAGTRVKAESYFDQYPELRDDFESAIELIYAEYLLGIEFGERPSLNEFCERFPAFAERLRMQLDLRSLLADNMPDELSIDSRSSRADAASSATGVSASRWPEIDGYQMVGVLGRGGMAVVYQAVHLGLKRPTAIKMIHGGRYASDDHLARFRDEAEAIARLRHPGIVQIYDYGEQDGRPYLSLEYVAGGSLSDHLKGTPLPAHLAARFAESIARAIHYAHEQGIVHRDLKPGNVLIQQADKLSFESATLKIADFGLAKLLDDDAPKTHSGAIVGTPSYMAPEQASGNVRLVSPATDIYALGAILYEMLTGRPPFQAETPLETLHLVIDQEPVAPRRWLPRVPRDLETICLKCLEKEPRARYGSAQEVADDLGRFQNDEPLRIRPTSGWERGWKWCRRNPLLAAVAGTALLLGCLLASGTGTAAYWWRWQRDQAVKARLQIERTERERTDRLWDSLVANARSIRHTESVGQRFDGLKFLREAAQLRFDPLLRNEAIACLALSDSLPAERTWTLHVPAGRTVHFDDRLDQYAVNEGRGYFEVRRVSDNQSLHRLPDPDQTPYVHCHAEFSPDGQSVCCCYDEDGVSMRSLVWDLQHAKLTLEFRGNERTTWMPSGDLLVFETGRCRPRVLDPHSGELRRQFAWEVADTQVMQVDPHLQRVAMTTWNSPVVRVADLRTGQTQGQFEVSAGPWPLAWNPDGRLLAVGSDDHRIHLWSAETDQVVASLEGHQDHVTTLSFHPRGPWLISGGWDQVIRVWDYASGKTQFQLFGKQPALSADGQRVGFQVGLNQLAVHRIWLNSECETVATWDVGNRLSPQSLRAKFAPRGDFLAVGNTQGLYSIDSEAKRERMSVPIGEIYDLAILPDGQMLTLSERGLWRWPVRATGTGEVTLGPPSRYGVDVDQANDRVCTSIDGTMLVILSQDRRRIRVLDFETQKVLSELISPHDVASLSISPDSRLIAVGHGWNSEVLVYDVATGARLRQVTNDVENAAVVFSPDGRWLVITGQFGHTFWNTQTWQPGPRWSREKEVGWPHPAAFSGDGQLVAFELSPDHVVVADGVSGRELAILTSPDRKAIDSVMLNRDGTCLALARRDRTIQWWDLRTIRRELLALELDWKQTNDRSLELRPDVVERAGRETPPIVRVELGELAPERQWHADCEQAIALAHRSWHELPDNATRCNHLAWVYVSGPPDLQRPGEALPLAIRASEQEPDNWSYQNTLGTTYFRLGDYRRAAKIFEQNVSHPANWLAGFDRLILSMCYHHLGDNSRAQVQLESALAWRRHTQLSPELAAEFARFRAEAAQVAPADESESSEQSVSEAVSQ